MGYEINFDRYFYEYEAPRDLDEINSEIREQRNRITDILEELEI